MTARSEQGAEELAPALFRAALPALLVASHDVAFLRELGLTRWLRLGGATLLRRSILGERRARRQAKHVVVRPGGGYCFSWGGYCFSWGGYCFSWGGCCTSW